ncbi:hypothetical protein LJ721_004714 [Salmonella enterica]|nr:hypothetical protein [Salmonella enterica]
MAVIYEEAIRNFNHLSNCESEKDYYLLGRIAYAENIINNRLPSNQPNIAAQLSGNDDD